MLETIQSWGQAATICASQATVSRVVGNMAGVTEFDERYVGNIFDGK